MKTMFDTIGVHQLHPHADNVRSHGLGDLEELTVSIREHGVLEPLIVAPHPAEFGEYVIIAGHRRHAAAIAAGVDEVGCVIRDDLLTTRAVIEAMLVENLHRAELSPIEEADAYTQLAAFDMSPADIADRVGRSEHTVRRRLALTALPATTRDQVHTGQLTLAQAHAVAEFSDDPYALDRLEKTAPAHIDHELRNLQSLRAARQMMDDRAEEVRVAGGTVTETETAFVSPAGAVEIKPWTVGFTIGDHRAQHPGCHLLQINRSRGSFEAFCTDPESHGFTPPTPPEDLTESEAAAEAERRAKERDAAEEQRRELAAADEARRGWFTQTMRQVPTPRREVTTVMLRQVLEQHIDWDDLLSSQTWLELAGWGDFDLDDETTRENLLAELTTYAAPRLVQLLWAATIALRPAESGLSRGAPVYELHPLIELGYEPVPVEQELLDRHGSAGGDDE